MAPAVHLTPRALEGLREYKYKPGGYTILDTLHAPLWEWMVNRLPMWLAPNLITLTGLIGVILSYMVSAWYLPNYVDPDDKAPRWPQALNAIAVVAYVNLDCLDGKQARRTRSSSPLGQLFDHGCDALSVHLLLGNIQTALGAPCGKLSALMQFLLFVPWILAHLEEYHSGNLLYGNGLVGVLEANYALAAIAGVSAVGGTKVWDTPLNRFIPFLPKSVTDYYVLRHAFFVAAVLGCTSIIIGQLGRLLGILPPAGGQTLSAREKGHKELGMAAVVRHLVMCLALVVPGAVWQALDKEPTGQGRLVSLTYGLMYALVSSQLIMCHMAKEPFKPSWWAYVVVLLGAANSVLRMLPARPLTAVLAAWSLAGYLHYVTGVVEQICAHLHIKCFSIKY